MEKLKGIFSVCLILTIFINQIACKYDKEKVLIAINCGGPHFTDSDGVEYIKVISY